MHIIKWKKQILKKKKKASSCMISIIWHSEKGKIMRTIKHLPEGRVGDGVGAKW